MKIRTLWDTADDIDDCTPWIVAALDEFSEEDGGGDDYFAKLDEQTPAPYRRRELIIEIPDSAIRALFVVPTVKADTK